MAQQDCDSVVPVGCPESDGIVMLLLIWPCLVACPDLGGEWEGFGLVVDLFVVLAIL